MKEMPKLPLKFERSEGYILPVLKRQLSALNTEPRTFEGQSRFREGYDPGDEMHKKREEYK